MPTSYTASNHVRRHLRENGQLSGLEGRRAEALKWGPDQERNNHPCDCGGVDSHAFVPRSRWTFLSTSIRLRLLPVVSGVSPSGKNLTNPYDSQPWAQSSQPVKPGFVTTQADLCLAWAKFGLGLQGRHP